MQPVCPVYTDSVSSYIPQTFSLLTAQLFPFVLCPPPVPPFWLVLFLPWKLSLWSLYLYVIQVHCGMHFTLKSGSRLYCSLTIHWLSFILAPEILVSSWQSLLFQSWLESLLLSLPESPCYCPLSSTPRKFSSLFMNRFQLCLHWKNDLAPWWCRWSSLELLLALSIMCDRQLIMHIHLQGMQKRAAFLFQTSLLSGNQVDILI